MIMNDFEVSRNFVAEPAVENKIRLNRKWNAQMLTIVVWDDASSRRKRLTLNGGKDLARKATVWTYGNQFNVASVVKRWLVRRLQKKPA